MSFPNSAFYPVYLAPDLSGHISKENAYEFMDKLAGQINSVSNTLPDGQMWVGNSANVATPVTLSGDIVVSNAGVVTVTGGGNPNATIWVGEEGNVAADEFVAFSDDSGTNVYSSGYSADSFAQVGSSQSAGNVAIWGPTESTIQDTGFVAANLALVDGAVGTGNLAIWTSEGKLEDGGEVPDGGSIAAEADAPITGSAIDINSASPIALTGMSKTFTAEDGERVLVIVNVQGYPGSTSVSSMGWLDYSIDGGSTKIPVAVMPFSATAFQARQAHSISFITPALSAGSVTLSLYGRTCTDFPQNFLLSKPSDAGTFGSTLQIVRGIFAAA